MVWYSNFFKNVPQFDMIHKVKGFGVVNKAEVDFFFFEALLLFQSDQSDLELITD